MKLVNCEDVVCIAHNYHSEFDMALADLNDLKEVLYDTPAIEAKPVVHAHWKRKNNETKCSNCEFIYYSNHDDFNYCPNCGAKMDGKVKE